MRKFLFSFVAVLAFAGLFGLQGAQSSNCTNNGPFNCSGGGPFWGTSEDIDCWTSLLMGGICGLSPCGTEWIFEDIGGGTVTYRIECVE